MDLLKFLKKKQVHSFETLLQMAADDPSYRVEFIKRILTEKLVIISKSDVGNEGFVKLKAGAKVSVYTFPDGRVPIFTSPERIRDKGIFKDNASFLEAKGVDILDFLKGAKLILNPYSDYGKEFSPEEVARLLDGTYFNPREIVVKEKTAVNIGQPVKYPTEVVKALSNLFFTKPNVVAAYLGWIHQPETNDPPHYIFAIDTVGNYKELIKEAGFIVQQILGTEEIVDFIQITNAGGINDYFIKSTQPFYIRKI